MGVLLLAIGVGILAYIAFVFFFPKFVPEEKTKRTKNALENLYENTLAVQSSSASESSSSVLKNEFEEESSVVKVFYNLPFMNKFYIKMLESGDRQLALPMIFILPALIISLCAGFLLAGFGPTSFVLGALAGYYVPYRHFKKKIRKRNEAFINMFPDVLDMIVRSVRSGFPVTTAFKMVAENTEYPVREEFQTVVNEIALGRTINEALIRLSHRINEPDIRFFVVVLGVQQETGGNLSEVVSNLSNVIRRRKQLRLKIKAMTSEGRATAVILGSLPFVVFLALYVIKRDYVELLWTDPAGTIVLCTAIGLVVAAMVVVNKMIDIDI